MPKYDKALYDAVESTLYSAYSLILEQLLLHEDGEDFAECWLKLTALGMRRDPAALTRSIYDYNQRRKARIQEERRAND